MIFLAWYDTKTTNSWVSISWFDFLGVFFLWLDFSVFWVLVGELSFFMSCCSRGCLGSALSQESSFYLFF